MKRYNLPNKLAHLKGVNKDVTKELIKCLIYSNNEALQAIGHKVFIGFEYRILREANNLPLEISLKISHIKPIGVQRSTLESFFKKNDYSKKELECVDIVEECLVGHKQHSYYLFVINSKGTITINVY